MAVAYTATDSYINSTIKDAYKSYTGTAGFFRAVSVGITTIGGWAAVELIKEPVLYKFANIAGISKNGDAFALLYFAVMIILSYGLFKFGHYLENSNFISQKQAVMTNIDVGLLAQYAMLIVYLVVFAHVMVIGSTSTFLAYILGIFMVSLVVSGFMDMYAKYNDYSAPIYYSIQSLLIALTTAFIGYYFDGDRLGAMFNKSDISELKKSEEYANYQRVIDDLKSSTNNNNKVAESYIATSSKNANDIANIDTRYRKNQTDKVAKIDNNQKEVAKFAMIANNKNSKALNDAVVAKNNWYKNEVKKIEAQNAKTTLIVQYFIFMLNFAILWFNLSAVRSDIKDNPRNRKKKVEINSNIECADGSCNLPKKKPEPSLKKEKSNKEWFEKFEAISYEEGKFTDGYLQRASEGVISSTTGLSKPEVKSISEAIIADKSLPFDRVRDGVIVFTSIRSS